MQTNIKTIGHIAYIAAVAAICTVPLVGGIFHWGSQSTENRTMLSLPKLLETTEDATRFNPAFTAKLGDYYAEHFGFRQELVTANAALNEILFGRSANGKTTVGKDGWYYFNETLDDYTGVSALSERGIYRLQKTITLMNAYAEEGNVTMLFFAAPNKNSIYPEFMPGQVRRSSKPSNLDRLNEAMRGEACYLDMKSLLLAQKAGETRDIYLKHDSHWNNLGALTAYNAMQDNLNSRIAAFDYQSVSEADTHITEIQILGDLTNTLYPSVKKTGLQYDLGLEKAFSADRPLTDLMAEISTTCEGRYYNEICYRDSFFNALIGINSNAFAKVRYTRALPYDMTAARNGNYHVAVVEIAERNLPVVLNKAPIMDAVAIELPRDRAYVKAAQRCRLADKGDYFTFNGYVGDWAALAADSNIYIELRDTQGKSYCYEAFPIAEEEPYRDDGFSARIDKYSLPNNKYDVYLHVGDGDSSRYTDLILDIIQ